MFEELNLLLNSVYFLNNNGILKKCVECEWSWVSFITCWYKTNIILTNRHIVIERRLSDDNILDIYFIPNNEKNYYKLRKIVNRRQIVNKNGD